MGGVDSISVMAGLSPRVRGNHPAGRRQHHRGRSIPACAGEPHNTPSGQTIRTVYPRVCGGTCRTSSRPASSGGLSPRVRGNPSGIDIDNECNGSIPACAGEPTASADGFAAPWVYPRVCGGTGPLPCRILPMLGLSPRVRGNRNAVSLTQTDLRSIPACAGEPAASSHLAAAAAVYPRVCGGTSVSPGREI